MPICAHAVLTLLRRFTTRVMYAEIDACAQTFVPRAKYKSAPVNSAHLTLVNLHAGRKKARILFPKYSRDINFSYQPQKKHANSCHLYLACVDLKRGYVLFPALTLGKKI